MGQFGGLPGLASVTSQIAAIAEREHARYGFTTDYYDSAALTWATHFAVQMATIQFCAPAVLCPISFNSLSSWYAPHPSRSFVLQDAQANLIDTNSTSQFGSPIATFPIDDEFTVYVYSYDVASRLVDTDALWAPTLNYGAGYNAAEEFNGVLGRWMIQNGQIEVDAPVAADLTLTTTAFANGQPRLLELLGRDGRVLARQEVPASPTPVQLGPFVLPAGENTLTFVSSPGPVPFGGNDPRRASIFFEPITLDGGQADSDGVVRFDRTRR
jgi:hypothetical protein